MARPFKPHWLFNNHDPEAFWDLPYLPVLDGDTYTVERLGEHTEPPQEDETDAYQLPVLVCPIEHLLADKANAMKPGSKEWRSDMKERFLTRWAAYVGRCVLLLETREGADGPAATVVRRDWLKSPAFRQGLFDAMRDQLSTLADTLPPKYGETYAASYVFLHKEKASTAVALVEALAIGGDHTLAIPKEGTEYYEFVVVPWWAWANEASLAAWLKGFDALHSDVEALEAAGVTVKDGIATFTVDVWDPEDGQAWASTLVDYYSAMQYMDKADHIPR